MKKSFLAILIAALILPLLATNALAAVALPAPTGLAWLYGETDSGTASWNAVVNATGYSVQLYKGENTLVGSPVTVKDASTTRYDFSVAIASSGIGEYWFQVRALSGSVAYDNSAWATVSLKYKREVITISIDENGNPLGDGGHYWEVTSAKLFVLLTGEKFALTGNTLRMNVLLTEKAELTAGTVDTARIDNRGTITGGVYTVTAHLSNTTSGIIKGGTFYGEIKNHGQITGGVFMNNINNIEEGTCALMRFDVKAFGGGVGVARPGYDNVGNYLLPGETYLVSPLIWENPIVGLYLLGPEDPIPTAPYSIDTNTFLKQNEFSPLYGFIAPDTASTLYAVLENAETLTAPVVRVWAGKTAEWNAISEATGYLVRLYKDGTADENLINETTVSGADTYDFSEVITANGLGDYYFKVQATGDSSTHIPSVWSEASEPYVSTAPTAAFSLSETTTYTFPVASLGYDNAQMRRLVTIANSGNVETGALQIALSGANANSFTLTKTAVPSIMEGSSNSFAVVPMNGLSVGTYTATVTVSAAQGDAIRPQSFDVSFTVRLPPLAAPTGLLWSGTFAKWSDVDDAVDYLVQLYKPSDDAAPMDPIYSAYTQGPIFATAQPYVDFAPLLEQVGSGTYYYQVKALTALRPGLPGAISVNFSDSVWSVESGLLTYTQQSLETPTNLNWSGYSALASPVSGAQDYNVRLYKDVNGVKEEIGPMSYSDMVEGQVAPSRDMSNLLAANGSGDYYFKFKALTERRSDGATPLPSAPEGGTNAASVSVTLGSDWSDYSGKLSFTPPVISFTRQPTVRFTATQGSIWGNLSATANVTPSGTATLKWYRCSILGIISGAPLAEGETFTIPTTLGAGTYYYLCQATAEGAQPVNSRISYVTIKPPYVPVAGITFGSARSVVINTDLTLSATVTPSNATNKTIVWSVSDAGTTGATITSGVLRATAPGTAVITATIANGRSEIEAFTQDFSIAITVFSKLTLPSSLGEIAAEAFKGTTFVEVVCPDGLKTIGAHAFAGCLSLRRITIPASVTAIASDAFDGCQFFTIVCAQDSYAMEYAVSNDFAYQTD